METTPSVAGPMLQLGLLMGIVIVGHGVAMRHLPAESVPAILRPRVLMCDRMRPWLSVAALAMTAAGLFLLLI